VKRVAITGAGVILLLAIAALYFLTRPAASSCSYPAPVNGHLPPILKSIGGFDQSRDPSDVADLEANAVSAATAQFANLIGVSAQSPVHEASVHSGPSATVVPLTRSTADGNRVVALVAYLSDCSGRVYYDNVEYFDSATITTYPSVSKQAASSRLNGQTPQLQFDSDPFHPFWVAGADRIAGS